MAAHDQPSATAHGSALALEARQVSKTFGGQRALDDFDFPLRRGTIHALLGHNGSGKSTFIKVLSGVHRPDSGGHIRIGEAELAPGSPRESARLGLRFVHQSLALVDELSAEDNIALVSGYSRRPFINWKAQRKLTEETLRLLDEDGYWPPNTPLATASALTRARLAIGRALMDLDNNGVLVLDEPTAALAPHEIDQLFASLHRVRSRGISVIYVTHRLREVHRIADEITLLRDGRGLGTHDAHDLSVDDLIDVLTGEGPQPSAPRRSSHTASAPRRSSHTASAPRTGSHGEVVLAVDGLHAEQVGPLSFSVDKGEILGICGLEGSGREAFAAAVTGAVPTTVTGLATPKGTAADLSLRTARRLGIVLARESRAPGASVDQFTIRENLSLPQLGRFSPRRVIRKATEVRFAHEWIDRLQVRPSRSETLLSEMSGGNRQKVIVARALALAPTVIVLDEPTTGVDIGTARTLHALFRQIAEGGAGVILVSSDSDELVEVADRVLVLREGLIGAELGGVDINESRLLSSMG